MRTKQDKLEQIKEWANNKRAIDNTILELPEVVNPESRQKAIDDVVYFCTNYCKSVITRPISAIMIEYLHTLVKAIDIGGCLQVMLPRGSGKTTLQKCFLTWALITGRLRYVVVFGANSQMSKGIISDCWFLMQSDEILADFPEIAYPILALNGVPIRALYQTYQGKRTSISVNSTEFHLPIIEGSLGSGGILKALGAGSAVRGLAHLDKRPDFILLDDIQTRKTASTSFTVGKLVNWVTQDVMGLAGPTSSLAICSTATPIKEGDLTDVLQDKTKHPEWATIRHPLITGEWPDLWEEYDKLYLAGLIAGDTSSACEFYMENREKLDKGLSVIDDTMYNTRLEKSAIQRARNLKVKLGDVSFNTEYQLKPLRATVAMSLVESDIYSKLTYVSRYHLPKKIQKFVAYIDVMQDKLRYCVTAFGPGNIASVIDYGAYPPKGEIAAKTTNESIVINRLSKALMELIEYLCQSNRYISNTGSGIKVSSVWVDSGWQTNTIYNICNLATKRHSLPIMPTKGTSSIGFNTMFRTKVLANGDNVALCENKEKQQYMYINADYWKKMAQSLWIGTIPLSNNSLSLFGDMAGNHVQFAKEICAEKLLDQGVSSKGFEFYQWRVDGPNHYLDCLAGSLACAAWNRFFESSLGMREIKAIASSIIEKNMAKETGKESVEIDKEVEHKKTTDLLPKKVVKKHRIRSARQFF